MWPKLLMQLVEFLPHATRLLPLADRYLASSSANSKGFEEVGPSLAAMRSSLTIMEESLSAMAAGVQGSLAQVAKTHVDVAERLDAFASEHLALAGKLEGLNGQVSEIGTEAKRARRAAELAQTRVDAIEKQLASLRTVLLAGLGVLALLLVTVVFLLLRGHAVAG